MVATWLRRTSAFSGVQRRATPHLSYYTNNRYPIRPAPRSSTDAKSSISPFVCHTEGVPTIVTKRTHVVLPVDVVADIDKLVGKRGRSAFLTEVAKREIKIRRQQEVLRETAGAWKSKDHPELARGAAEWVREIRSLDKERLEKLEGRRRGNK